MFMHCSATGNPFGTFYCVLHLCKSSLAMLPDSRTGTVHARSALAFIPLVRHLTTTFARLQEADPQTYSGFYSNTNAANGVVSFVLVRLLFALSTLRPEHRLCPLCLSTSLQACEAGVVADYAQWRNEPAISFADHLARRRSSGTRMGAS